MARKMEIVADQRDEGGLLMSGMALKIRRFKRTDHYYVEVNGVGYEMSDDADMPNGVCMTVADGENVAYPDEDQFTSETIEQVPVGIAKQIMHIALFQASEEEHG
jgi:hypothetical protein